MSQWPRMILFDFDGVIVNSEPLHFHAFREVLADEGIDLSEAEYYEQLIGFDDRGAFTYLFNQYNRPLEPQQFTRLMARKSEVVRDLIRRGEFGLPGAAACVRGLQPHYPLAICSGALRHEIEAMLDAIGLREAFGVIVAAEDVTVGKPDPQGYLLTMKRLSQLSGVAATPADCLVVEDAPSVIRSVRAAGFAALGVATSYPPHELAEADWVVDQLEPAALKRQLPDLKGLE